MLLRDAPVVLVAANVAAMALSVATAPLIARSLGPDGRGETAAAIAAFTLVPVLLAIGVPLELRRRAAREDVASSVRTFRVLLLVGFIPAVGVAFLLDLLIFHSFSPTARAWVFAGLVMSPIVMSWSASASVLVAQGRYRAVAAVRLAQPAPFFAGAVALILLDQVSVASLLAANIASNVVAALVGAFLVRVKVRGHLAPIRPLLARGGAFAGSAVAEAASGKLPQILILPLLGAQDAGYFSVAATLAILPIALAQALGGPLLRDVSDARTPEQRRAVVESGVQSSVSVILVGTIALAAVVPLLVPLLFGPEFVPAIVPSLLMLIGAAGNAIALSVSMLLVGLGRGATMSLSQVLSLAVSTVLLFVLVKPFGLYGAVSASVIGAVVLVSALLFGLRVRPASVLPRWTALKRGMRAILR